MSQLPLKYSISDWHQLSQCLSNASRDLSISVSDLIQNDILTGLKLSVNHAQFGSIFTYIINPKGNLIYNKDVKDITSGQILDELSKYGFLVEFSPQKELSIDQLNYLKEIQNLHFDKIRKLSVHRTDGKCSEYVVAFMVSDNPRWLDNTYSTDLREFTDSITDGTAINMTLLSETRNYDWSWLDFVANIQDIIDENEGD